MRKITLGMAVAAVALATPAMARDGSGYFGADIGYTDAEAHKVYSSNALSFGRRKRMASNWALSSGTTGARSAPKRKSPIRNSIRRA